MIKTQELKAQIEELTKQNDMMLSELEQMKRLIGSGQPSGQNAPQHDENYQMQNRNNNNQGTNQKQNGRTNGSGGDQTAQLANDLLQIKDLVAKLEQKTSQYVSSQTGGSLTEKDVVNLVLTLINGMVDWSSEFISGQAAGSGQTQ